MVRPEANQAHDQWAVYSWKVTGLKPRYHNLLPQFQAVVEHLLYLCGAWSHYYHPPCRH